MSNLHDIIHTFIGLLAIVNPLAAVPMFISLTTANSEAEKRKTARLSTLLVAVLTLLVWIVLHLAEYLAKWLGATGLNIVNRIMGLLLAAIAVGLITEGLKVLLSGLG